MNDPRRRRAEAAELERSDRELAAIFENDNPALSAFIRRAIGLHLRPFTRRLTVALVGLAVVVVTAFLVVDDANDRQDAATLDAAVGTCNRGNDTRTDINQLNAAVAAVASAVESVRLAVDANAAAVDGTAASLIAAFESVGDGLTAEGRAAADAFLEATSNLTATVRAQLSAARAALDLAMDALTDAVLALRDCRRDVVRDNPGATLPPTTAPPAPGVPVITDVP